MKNIFGAKAQTATFVKSILLLMLMFLVTFGVTSCKNETAPAVTVPANYEPVLDAKASPIPPAVETEKQLQELGTNTEIDYKSLCIGGGTAGQERRALTIGGNGAGSALPRNLTDIGGQSCPRQLSEIGGNQTGHRLFAEIGGQGSVPQRALNDHLTHEMPIGGHGAPRT